ncbi:hypothetical protein QL285_021192 [Trifolium repens]|nr:hypothetical protein QL285_021192 [Trifolium repens]
MREEGVSTPRIHRTRWEPFRWFEEPAPTYSPVQWETQNSRSSGYMVRTSDLARPDQPEGQDSNPTTSNPVLHLNEDHHAHACFRTQDLPIKRSGARDLRNRSDDHDMFS